MAVGEAEAIHLQRLPDGGQGLVHHERTLHERGWRLVAIDQCIKSGAGKMNRPSLGEDIRQGSGSPKKPLPANARQRNPAGLEDRVGCPQFDSMIAQRTTTGGCSSALACFLLPTKLFSACK